MPVFERIFFIVLDACGVGELPDAASYGDEGSSTIPNTASAVGGLDIPNLQRLGLGKIVPILGVDGHSPVLAAHGKMGEKSPGKDSTTGHWEHFGVILDRPFPVYPNGFPHEVIDAFKAETGYQTIGNIAASGTEIISRLGPKHIESGKLIVYTSADSVFQIAAHESTVSTDELYRICLIAREILTGAHGVGRVIARPFTGQYPNFVRTAGRRDFSLPPPHPFVTQKLIERGIEVISIGKISDIMAGLGISRSVKTSGNMACMDALIDTVTAFHTGLVMTNLVDFDMLWGHRNDVVSFAKGLEVFDQRLGELLLLLKEHDLLIITADHGCDPTTLSTDHSREYVPVLAYFSGVKSDINLGVRQTFADTGKTIAENYGIADKFPGTSFLSELLRGD